MQSVRK